MNSPILLADNGRGTSSLSLDVLGAPGFHQVIVMLAAQLLLFLLLTMVQVSID